MLKSKIHRATVTESNLYYEGSITIDEALLKAADILANEKVEVLNINNGVRLETYAIAGKKNSGIICMNGAASHLITTGEEVTIMAFEYTDTPTKPKCILVDTKNTFIRYL